MEHTTRQSSHRRFPSPIFLFFFFLSSLLLLEPSNCWLQQPVSPFNKISISCYVLLTMLLGDLITWLMTVFLYGFSILYQKWNSNSFPYFKEKFYHANWWNCSHLFCYFEEAKRVFICSRHLILMNLTKEARKLNPAYCVTGLVASN